MPSVKALGRLLWRMMKRLVLLAIVAFVGFRLGFSSSYQEGNDLPDWAAVSIERQLGFHGAVNLHDLPLGVWARACLFGAFDDWGEAPMPHRGKPPWTSDQTHVTLVLAEASGTFRSFRLRWLDRAPDTPNCVPVGVGTKLVDGRSEGKSWLLHFE
jgi:hypothetical protein